MSTEHTAPKVGDRFIWMDGEPGKWEPITEVVSAVASPDEALDAPPGVWLVRYDGDDGAGTYIDHSRGFWHRYVGAELR